MLDIVLALDRRSNVVKSFKIDEAFQPMSLGKPVNESGSMLKNATHKIVRDPDIQNAVGPICQDIDVTASCHGAKVKDVDGRDKPGHDGHACAVETHIMIPVTSFAGKTVAVFGLGGSGLASCHALKAGGAEVIAGDDSADNVAKAAQAGFITADLRTVSWANFAALILTPGAPLTHPAPHWSVLAARQAGVEVIGDIELFCRERRRHAPDAPFVAITGTNGKSTTTALIAHLMRWPATTPRWAAISAPRSCRWSRRAWAACM